VGFSSFYSSSEFCFDGISNRNIRVNYGQFRDKDEIKLKDNLSTYALMTRAAAGTPTIKNSNGSLQIIFNPRDGSKRRKCLSLGLPESKQNRIFAELAVKRIQNDILAGHFDGDLDKYKPQTSGKAKEVTPIDNLTIRDIWDSYTEYKRPQLSQTTLAVDFERVSNYIDRFPTKSFSAAVAVRDWLLSTTTPGQAKRVLKNLSACGKWAAKSKIIPGNTFEGMAADIANGKGRDDELDINPFSIEERDLIIKKFWADVSHYAPLVEFLFRTGCRPSEAIALQKRHLAPGYKTITFEQAITIGDNKRLSLKQGLKTQKKRVFPCGEGLKIFLESIDPQTINQDTFIFISPKGKFVDFQNFSVREWKPILRALRIEERKPYQMRHSFITFCIDMGIDAKDISKWVGNSPEIIYKHYAGAKKDLIAPDIG
jgi:integrase